MKAITFRMVSRVYALRVYRLGAMESEAMYLSLEDARRAQGQLPEGLKANIVDFPVWVTA